MVVFFIFELEFKIPLRWRGGGAADGVVDPPKEIATSTRISNHYSLKPPRLAYGKPPLRRRGI